MKPGEPETPPSRRHQASSPPIHGSACSTASVTYVEDSTPPSPPVLATTTPGSPANDSTPIVNGTAEAASTVRLYGNAACSGANLGTGAATGGVFSIAATAVADDSTTTYYATATDAASNTSTCTAVGLTYVEDSTPPSPPSALTTSPVSPANNNNPTISGSAESGATVAIYSDSGCTTLAGSTVAAGGAFSRSVAVGR